jgi:alpha-L-fucosidase
MNEMVYGLQPDILINNRNQLPGDFGTPEGHIVPENRAWEACMTFNDSWGYAPIEPEYRTPRQVHQMLRQCAASGGNLLLNCGPSPEGVIPDPQPKILKQVGKWLDQYGASIYEATDPVQEEWTFLGAFTRKGDTLYYHVNRWPGRNFSIGGLQCQIESAKIMGGKKLKVVQEKDRVLLKGVPTEAPGKLCTVIEMKFTGEPTQTLGYGCVILPKDPWGKI